MARGLDGCNSNPEKPFFRFFHPRHSVEDGKTGKDWSIDEIRGPMRRGKYVHSPPKQILPPAWNAIQEVFVNAIEIPGPAVSYPTDFQDRMS